MAALPWPQSEIVSAARHCVGARFRVHGRDPRIGLDCVGLAAFAYRAVDVHPDIPDAYDLRGGSVRDVNHRLGDAGFVALHDRAAAAGDLLVIRPAPRQIHFAIHSGMGFIHADLALRRVVETPGAPHWPSLGTWRWRSAWDG